MADCGGEIKRICWLAAQVAIDLALKPGFNVSMNYAEHLCLAVKPAQILVDSSTF
jgi:hypothetical protein